LEEDVRLTAREVDVLRQLSLGVAYAQAARGSACRAVRLGLIL
jgi:DNA-binding CsgD family transcriptional regulator